MPLHVDAVPTAILLLAMVPLWLPVLLTRRRVPVDPAAAVRAQTRRATLILALLLGLVTLSPNGAFSYLTLGFALFWQALGTRVMGRGIASTLIGSALAAAVAAGALALQWPVLAFAASTVAIALRVGVFPLHSGIVALAERSPATLTQVFGATLVLVLEHLRFTDHIPFAYDVAPWLVRFGALVTLLPGLMALVQPDLRGYLRTATAMHGGMILAALGAAGRGHEAAALMVMLTTTFALGGLGLSIASLEARVGPVSLVARGGRVQAFPRLAAAFALFAAAGVAMPGTAGFIADDLMLHALWGESVGSTVMIILGAAALAIASLRAYAAAFLGPAVSSLAPDLNRRERTVTTALVVILVILGFIPGVLLTPADLFLNASDAP